MVQITGRVADSAGQASSGRVEFAQAQRFDTGELLVTGAPATAQVINGELRALDGALFVLPANPDGTAVRVREMLGGRTYEWWTTIPQADTVEYRLLEPVESAQVPASVWGPPPWLADAHTTRDETVAALDAATDLVDTLGGLSGLQGLVGAAETAATAAGTSATTATTEADRAEAAAASIDMTAINTRLDGVDASLSTVQADLTEKADADTVAAEIAPLKPARSVEGVSLYSYGHSYTMYPGPYSTPHGGEYQLRVGKRLDLGTVHSRGRSGTPAPDTLARALAPNFGWVGGVDPRWTPGDRGIVLLQNYMNEAAADYGSDTKYQDMWLRSIRSLIALFSAQEVITADAATKVGTWTASTGPARVLFAGENLVFAQASGAELRYTVTGDEAWIIAAASSSYSLGSFQAICNGATLRTVASSGINPTYTSTVDPAYAGTYWPCAWKVTGLNAAAGTTGSKTLIVRTTSATTTFQNGVIVPSATPPAVFLAKEPTRNPNAASTTASTRFAANRAAYEAMVDQIASEFPHVHAVDLEPGWDNTRFVSSLDVNHRFHPNDLGMQHIAAAFEAAIRTHLPDPVSGVMVL